MKSNKKRISREKAIMVGILTAIIIVVVFEFIISPAHFSGSSMEPTISENDLAIIYYQPNDIKVGDIIVFESKISDNWVGHRIIEIEDERYYTKGDNNNIGDGYPLTREEIKAVIILIIPTSKVITSIKNYFTSPKIFIIRTFSEVVKIILEP